MSRQIDLDMMWAIGLFEGEGCICLSKRKGQGWKMDVRLELTSTDLDVLKRFHSIVGFGTTRVRSKAEGCKTAWRWVGSQVDDVAELLALWIPHLGERRRGKVLKGLAVYYRPYKKRAA